MNIIERMKELEDKTLKIYEALVILQTKNQESIEGLFSSKIISRIHELREAAQSLQDEIDKKYFEII